MAAGLFARAREEKKSMPEHEAGKAHGVTIDLPADIEVIESPGQVDFYLNLTPLCSPHDSKICSPLLWVGGIGDDIGLLQFYFTRTLFMERESGDSHQ